MFRGPMTGILVFRLFWRVPCSRVLIPLGGYHGEPKVNLFHNIRIIQGFYPSKRLKVTYSTTRSYQGS